MAETQTPAPCCPNCARLEAENARLRAAVEELRRGGKRQAAPFSKGPPKEHPRTPGRKAGEAHGRHAHREPSSKVDEEHEAPLPPTCPFCGQQGLHETETVEQYQDEICRRPIRRRFHIHVGRCRHCGRRVQGRHPLQTGDAGGAAAAQVGPDAQAVVVSLNKEAGLSHGKVCRVMRDTYGISLTRGGAAQIVLRAGRRCQPHYREILAQVRQSPCVTPDETGWKVAGALQWLWAFVTKEAVLYAVRPSRGKAVIAEVLGADYAGATVHDGWRPYEVLAAAVHQTCLRHLLVRCRDLLAVATRGAVRFPRAVKALLGAALVLRDRRDAGRVSPHGLAVVRGRLEARCDRLLTWHRRHADNERFAAHLARNREWLFTFLYRPGLAATNYEAEQAVRPAVVNRKVWGGNRTEAGARAQEILTSFFQTCLKQGKVGVDFLSQVLRSLPGHVPKLLPVPAAS